MRRVAVKAASLICAAVLALGRFEPTTAAAATSGSQPVTGQPVMGQPVMGQPVIIDTDIGDDIDDAFALTIALLDPRLDVIGVTTAWGDTRSRTLLVRRLLTTLGRQNVVVAQGPATPNKTLFTQKKW